MKFVLNFIDSVSENVGSEMRAGVSRRERLRSYREAIQDGKKQRSDELAKKKKALQDKILTQNLKSLGIM